MKTNPIKNKTAFITGASSGIGKACAEQFAAHGCNLVITARRGEHIRDLSKELITRYSIKCLPIELDVRKPDQIERALEKVSAEDIKIDILINNAGLALGSDKIQDGDVDNWERMIDTNVKGLLYVTKAILPGMIKRNQGHIVNIGSVTGHGCYTGGNVYSATKFAVRALSKSLRLDLHGTALRVSEVDPGAVETEFSIVRWNDTEKAKKFYQGFQPLVADDIADAVVYCVTRPPHVNISELVVYPQAQSALTDIYRVQ
jgi:3-hydroxy acid dehydrogenase / malonic semialdehyde reductase